jgi:hypothetical protein
MPSQSAAASASKALTSSFFEPLSRAESAVLADRSYMNGGARTDITPASTSRTSKMSQPDFSAAASPAGMSGHEADDDEGSDFEYEAEAPIDKEEAAAVSAVAARTQAAAARSGSGAQAAAMAAANVPSAPVAESAQRLHRLAAFTRAEQLRNLSDDELLATIRAVRELHATWLHADAALINTTLQCALLKEDAVQVEDAFRTEHKVLTQERVTCASKLADAEARIAELEAETATLKASLSAKNAECDGLTMALQQAILEQKGVAESKQKWRR